VDLAGDRAIVGANHVLPVNPTISGNGAAYVYERQANRSWVNTVKLVAPNGASFDHFGFSVALSGDRVFVGAPATDEPGKVNLGSAYGFRLCQGCAVEFGTGTPGCSGVQHASPSKAPEIGASAFSIRFDHCPPLTLGTAFVGSESDVAGSDPLGLGALLHVDFLLSPRVSAIPVSSDVNGRAGLVMPLTYNTAMVSEDFTVCSLWPWTNCPVLPQGYSSSRGLRLTYLAP
jgi:hypothetical protein